MAGDYRFSFGPWNIHEGADPFGPPVRPSVSFAEKLKLYKQLGFDAVQFHDDDAVPDLENLTPAKIRKEAAAMKKTLKGEGLIAEFVAPRLWEHANGIDGGFTANDPKCRKWAIERAKRTIDVAKALGTKLIVLWLAREGTYIRESKNAIQAHGWLLEAINTMLEYDAEIEIAIEPKPNEPTDLAYLPTIGHALALAQQTADPKRVGGLIETAHALLAGLDPSDEMAFALSMGKLYSVHLNDQNGLNGIGRESDAHAKGRRGLQTLDEQPRDLPAAGRQGPHVPGGHGRGTDRRPRLRRTGDAGAGAPDGQLNVMGS